MHIYIDESGIFAPSEVESQWSSVGALVVPDNAVDETKTALETLKIALGVEVNEEIKRQRPDCSSVPYEFFITKLNQIGCTLHVVSTSGGLLQGDQLEKHRVSTKQAINKYFEIKGKPESLCQDACSLIDKLSAQQFSQCILQTYLVSDLVEKTIPHYARVSPESLGQFFWEFDRKDVVETSFEQAFQMIYVGRVQATSSYRPLPLIQSPDRNYGYFFESFVLNDEASERPNMLDVANMFGNDLSVFGSSLGAFNVSSLLVNSFKLVDSKTSSGVQVADLLVSSVNRCLKGNYTNNEKMASILGGLMINSPKSNVRAISLMGFSETRELKDSTGMLVNLMDENSKKLFSEEFIRNSERYYQKI